LHHILKSTFFESEVAKYFIILHHILKICSINFHYHHIHFCVSFLFTVVVRVRSMLFSGFTILSLLMYHIRVTSNTHVQGAEKSITQAFYLQFSQQSLKISKRNLTKPIQSSYVHILSYQHVISFQRFKVISISAMPRSDFVVLEKGKAHHTANYIWS